MKPLVIIGIFIGILLVAGVGVYVLSGNVAPPITAAHRSVRCQSPGTAYQVVIRNNVVQPKHVDAVLCDSLTITNEDKATHIVAFGPHANHITYDGVSETIVGYGQKLSVTLNQPGDFLFHDHLDQTIYGTFTVKSR